ncbi:hypothetical protein SCLCIDRAFT_115593 [Scleroderma citrinum Foug A]|uniref:Choline/carnitine acyltransferase domain-containing protein n=1 Tax=Scleroderma citrinum Foug A TaxID=1036808 RepID=A0A0C2ZRU3_9AGAM|nr:hypothetical protein SCLCIDRAFT_115593 [Scleroderma citrinum Foug A]
MASTRLPRLPVPDLPKTMAKYMVSVQPVLLQDELDGGPPFTEALRKHEDIVRSFLNGPGQTAQARLLALDKASPHNWLDDNFWLKKIYLECRAPLLINSNWWLTFINDTDVPEKIITDQGQGFTPWQIRRAASLVHGVVDFKYRVQSQELYPDTTRVGIWLRRCTSVVFNTCRIPQRGCDTLAPPAAHTSPWTSNIVVMAHDFFYTLRVVEAKNGTPLGVDEIERGIRCIILDVLRRRRKGETAVRVGVLSSDDRDEWAKNYTLLRSLSLKNVHSLDAIHQSLFVLSLDHWPAPSASDANKNSALLTFPTDKAVQRNCPVRLVPPKANLDFSNPAPYDLFDHQQRTRASPALQNRFFDKPLQLIVERTTRAGACGEHSPVDALVPSVICEWAIARASGISLVGGMEDVPLSPSEMAGTSIGSHEDASLAGCKKWGRLDFDASPQIEAAIADATHRAEKLVTDSDHNVLYFTAFGGHEMQRMSNYSPDAFVQLALQLSYYRLHGRTTPVYETALTRSFHHGRTETIRSLTRESFTFVRMCGPWKGRSWKGYTTDSEKNQRDTSSSSLFALLTSALRAHALLTRAATAGRGIDRHLLGLRCVLDSEWDWLDSLEDGNESRSKTQEESLSDLVDEALSANGSQTTPRESVALFEHPTFWKSQTWRLSTSGLTEGWHFRGTGFGAPFNDGYGINYLIAPTSVRFCIDSKHSCPITSTQSFMTQLTHALRDMQEICLDAQSRDEESGEGKGSCMSENVPEGNKQANPYARL